jgi:hypothetical protein
MKASHDSLTGYPLRQWWLCPLVWTARTQTKTIERQLDAGVRYFDLRFRHNNGKLYAAHGVMLFDITIEDVFDKLANKDVWVRIILENQLLKDDITLEQFKEMIPTIPNGINVDWIGEKLDWKTGKVLFYGRNDFNYSQIKQRQKEINEEPYQQKEPYVYECYSYKMLPFMSKLIKAKNDSMINFV